VLTSYAGNRDEKTQWEAYKQEMAKRGGVVEEVRKLDTSNALRYEQALKLSSGDMHYDAVDIVKEIFITEAKMLSQIYSNNYNEQFLAVKDYLYNSVDKIYRAYNEIGVYDEDTIGHVIATVASVLAETTTIRYGEEAGNFNYYDATMRASNKSTYFMSDWDWSNRANPLKNYEGNNGQPKLDCAAFVGLVLDIAGITNGTEGKDYNAVKGLNLIGKYNGVKNIVESGLFREVKANEVKVGDLAYSVDKNGEYTHILIVKEIDNKGTASKYIHSSIYDYIKKDWNEIGVQISPFSFDKGSIKYIRYRNNVKLIK
ncbi:MAG: hypothetical protein WBK20_04405, partial [Spirochaetota bacterium]